jgi:hypothetical protein
MDGRKLVIGRFLNCGHLCQPKEVSLLIPQICDQGLVEVHKSSVRR